MHEHSVIAGLIRKLQEIAESEGVDRIHSLTVRLGALCHLSPDHFREHFLHESRGTAAENASLLINVSDDISDANAQEVLLESIELDPL